MKDFFHKFIFQFEDIRCAGRTAPDPEEPNNNRSSSTSTSKTEANTTPTTPTDYTQVQQTSQADISSVQFADNHSPANY